MRTCLFCESHFVEAGVICSITVGPEVLRAEGVKEPTQVERLIVIIKEIAVRLPFRAKTVPIVEITAQTSIYPAKIAYLGSGAKK